MQQTLENLIMLLLAVWKVFVIHNFVCNYMYQTLTICTVHSSILISLISDQYKTWTNVFQSVPVLKTSAVCTYTQYQSQASLYENKPEQACVRLLMLLFFLIILLLIFKSVVSVNIASIIESLAYHDNQLLRWYYHSLYPNYKLYHLS